LDILGTFILCSPKPQNPINKVVNQLNINFITPNFFFCSISCATTS